MNASSMRDLVTGLTVAMGGITFPYWSVVVSVATGIQSAVLQIGGLVVLGLTIWKLATELRIARKKLKDGE